MKYKMFFLLLGLLLFTFTAGKTKELPLQNHPVTDTNPDWRLAVQLWSFHKYTFFEALDKADSLGISWIEAYPGQPLGKEFPDIKFGHEMPLKYRIEVKKRLLEKGLHLVNYGVVAS